MFRLLRPHTGSECSGDDRACIYGPILALNADISHLWEGNSSVRKERSKMRGLSLCVAGLLAVALLLSGSLSASAAAPALPKSDFPKNAKITFMPSVSNSDIDTSWSVDTNG